LGAAREGLEGIVERMKENPKALQVFVADVGGKQVNWNMSFQFNLDGEDPFYLEINDQQISVEPGNLQNAAIIISGDSNSITKICQGKGDFTHGISREEITVQKGKVMDIIRLTRAITIVLKTK